MAHPRPVAAPARRRSPVTWVLVLLWIAWVGTALLCAPRQDDGHLLRQDVMQHRVTDFNTVAQPPAGPAAMLLGQHDTDTDAGYLVWQVAGQQRRHVDFATAKVVLSELSDLELPQETSDLGIVQNRMADATDVHAVGMSDPVPVIVLGCLLFGTALLGVLGAPPQTGSRWYWIWIIGILGGLVSQAAAHGDPRSVPLDGPLPSNIVFFGLDSDGTAWSLGGGEPPSPPPS